MVNIFLGVQCNICKLVTDGELIEFPNIPTEMCKKINCCKEAVDVCTICRNEAFCKSCCVVIYEFYTIKLIFLCLNFV